MSEFVSSKIVTARKDYVCCICSQRINKGDKYECNTNTQDGRIYSLKTCMKCFTFIKDNCYKCKDRSDCFEDITSIYECIEQREEAENE